MKIIELVNGLTVALTNEERNFVMFHTNKILVSSLGFREELVARSLVRKGVYDISDNSEYLQRK